MILFNYCYYYFTLLFLVHAKYLAALKCHECNGMMFNYSLTIENIPAPTTDDCEIVSAQSSCSVRVGWYENGATEVYYGADTPLPIDSILAKTERKVTTWSGEYETRRFIVYNCEASNSTPCNTVDSLKRAIASTTFPTDEQIEKFDSLIVPTTDFDGRVCLNVSNRIDCRETNLASCQQCIGIIEYSEPVDICATCPAGKAIANFFDYETTYFLNNQTRSDTIRLGCRKYGACNSVENMDKIKNTLKNHFDFGKFHSSTVSITISSSLSSTTPIVLIIVLIIGWLGMI